LVPAWEGRCFVRRGRERRGGDPGVWKVDPSAMKQKMMKKRKEIF